MACKEDREVGLEIARVIRFALIPRSPVGEKRNDTFGQPSRGWKPCDRKPVKLTKKVDFETAS